MYEDEFDLSNRAPHSLEAEMCALGCAMLARNGVDAILELLPDADLLYHPAHKKIHSAIMGLAKEGQAVDLVTVKNWALSRGFLPEIGGWEYLYNLHEVVPIATHARHYCRIVRDYATLRNLQTAGKQIVEVVNDPDLDPRQKVEKAMALIGTAESSQVGQGITADKVDFDAQRVVVPWKLGLIGAERMDRVGKLGSTTGGLYCGQVTLLEADTGVGKSWALQQTVLNACRQGYRVRIIQLADMTETDVANRIIGMMTGITYKPGSGDGLKRWQEAEDEFRSWGDRFEIYDSSARGNSDNIQEIIPWVKHRQRELPAQVLGWDYVQMLRWRGKTQNLTEELNLVSRELEQLARHDIMSKCATIVLSQVNKEGQTQYSTQPEKIAAVRVQITKADDEDWLKWTIKKHRFKPVRGYAGEWLRDPRGQFYDR